MGVVGKLNKSNDNKVRGAIVRYVKNGHAQTIATPINKLFPVEYKKHEDEILPKFIDERDLVKNTGTFIFIVYLLFCLRHFERCM